MRVAFSLSLSLSVAETSFLPILFHINTYSTYSLDKKPRQLLPLLYSLSQGLEEKLTSLFFG